MAHSYGGAEWAKSQDRGAEDVRPRCGVCEQPADIIATVPMCGERPRYPMCFVCYESIDSVGYAEEPELIDGRDDG